MSGQLFRRLERFRKRQEISILKLCKEIGCNNVTYHRWKKTGQITGPYKKIVKEFLGKGASLSQSPFPVPCDIAVIGLACYYPGAANIKELWENILARRVQFRRMLDSRLSLSDYYDPDQKSSDKTYITKAALIEGFVFDWSKRRIPRKTFESTDIVHWLALDTALRALEDAGYKPEDIPKENTGVIVGNTLTGEQTRSQTLRLRWPFVKKTLDVTLVKFGLQPQERQNIEAAMEGIYKSAFYPITEDSLAGGLANTIAGRICNYLNFKGGGYIVDGACSSSLLAVATAANALKNGELDIALAGGVDISLDPFELVGFARVGALAKDKMCVYDRSASGFIPGEGCGFVILKRLEDAVRDGNYIYAVVKGWGISSDGKGGIMEPSISGQALAIERAYKNVPYKITDINFIEGHGTGTAKGDRVELEGITTALAKEAPKDLKRVYGITSFKSIVGHTKAAAGIGGFIKAVLAVNQRILPPTANCRQPNEIFEGSGKCLYPVTQGVILDAAKPVRGGISSAGFGGINCHIAIESKDQPKQELKPAIDERALLVSNQETEVFVFASSSINLLRNLIGKFKDDLRFISQAEMADLSARFTKNIKRNAPVKVAVVTDSPENLYQALCLIEETLSKDIPEGEILKIKSPNPNIHIFLGNRTKQVRIGFLYPGQSSQRLNMTRTLFERFAWARDLAAVTKTPIAQYIYKPLDQFLTAEERSGFETELSRTEITQTAVTFSSLVWTEFLAKLGIEPDAVGGHSLGELSAFYKAGALTKDELLKFAEFRGQVMAASGKNRGAMASLGCSHSKAEELIRRMGGNLVAANVNSPLQTVISGDKSDIEKVIKEAKKEDIVGVLLPVSNAFHSAFMKESCAKIKGAKILSRSFRPSKPALYSCMDGKQLTGPVWLNEYFSQQVISPVRFTDLMASMSRECDLLIEVGPGRVLTDFVKTVNKDNGPACLSAESTVGNDRDLNLVLAELFVRNVPIQWEEAYNNRLIRPFVPVSKRKFIVNQCERPLKVPEDTGEIPVDYEKVIQGVIQSMVPVHVGEGASQNQSSQESLAPSNGRVSDTLIHFVEKLTGFNKESLQLNLRLLDDLNLDSIKAAELIAEVAKALGIPGEIEPAQYSNRTLDEIRQKFEELVKHKQEGRGIVDNQVNVLKRYQDKAWVRNFVERFEPQDLKEEAVASRIFKNILIISDVAERGIANILKEKFKNSKVRILDSGEVDVDKKPECVIAILPSYINVRLTMENLYQKMERLHKIIAVAANSKDILFAQLGSGDFKEVNIRALGSTLHLERPDLRIRIIDFDKNLKDRFIIEQIQKELKPSTTFTISGYTAKGERQVPIFEVSSPISYKKRDIQWSKKDVVLITGGAKGITAECALEFGRLTKANMMLVGRSKGDAEIEKTLKHFKQEGLTCKYFQCDVGDADHVEKVIKEIQKQFGPITAVIHGAGLNSLRRLKHVKIEDAYKEALPKVMGAVNILEALEGSQLKFFVPMASIIGIAGMEASGWYGFANEAFIQYLRVYKIKNRGVQIIVPAFSVWDEVGMGVKLGSVNKLAERGIGAIPVAEGVRRFRELIERDPQTDQVIITSRVPGLDTLRLNEFESKQNWRFIEGIKYYLPQVELIVQANLNVKDDPYVLDHNWKGSLLFPMVFGLEAMAQAACYVIGVEQIKNLRFKNIVLERPIPVNQESGAIIEVHAQVLEEENNKNPRIKVGIYSEQTGYKEPHFSAIFEMNGDAQFAKVSSRLKARSQEVLDINPQTDLYGPILFQGGLFQCIEKIHELFYNEKTRKGECLLTLKQNKSLHQFLKSTPKFNRGFLIGDPFFIDSILQSMQLIIPQDLSLPRSIAEIDINVSNSINDIKENVVNSNIHKISSEQGIGSAETANIKIKNCDLKIFQTILERPSANDLVNPCRRDGKIIEERLRSLSQEIGFTPPVVQCLSDRGLKGGNKEERHKIELPVIGLAVKELLKRENKRLKNFSVKWDKSGKPFIVGKELKDINVSLSHDGDFLLVVAGHGKQGCDAETIHRRSKSDWLALLGRNKYKLLDGIDEKSMDINKLGTAVWSAIETVKKSYRSDEEDFEHTKGKPDIFLFKINKDGNERVLGLPVKFTLGEKKIVSFLISLNQNNRNRNSKGLELISGLGYNQEIFSISGSDDGPQGQMVYIQRFPVTFKCSQALSRRVYFTNYFSWMGEVREHGLYPIMNKISQMAETGGWGLATNSVKTKILGELRSYDVVEVRLWLEKISGIKEGTFDFVFEWRKLLSASQYERVAISKLRSTWIQITGHGEARLGDLPDFMKNFMDSMKPKSNIVRPLPPLPEPLKDLSPGRTLSDHTAHKLLISEERFKTALEDSNLVGNIYFANYPKWLARTIDSYFYRLVPDCFVGIGQQGEVLCLYCEIEHLREAMPFDNIVVRMYLERLFECGMDLYFEYYKLNGDENPGEKLSFAHVSCVWVERTQDQKPIVLALPVRILENLSQISSEISQ